MVSYYGTDARDYSRHKLSMTISFVSTEHTGLGNMKVMEMVALGRYPYTNWLGALTIMTGVWSMNDEANRN
jgi:iron complex transport system ATP-binding protein